MVEQQDTICCWCVDATVRLIARARAAGVAPGTPVRWRCARKRCASGSRTAAWRQSPARQDRGDRVSRRCPIYHVRVPDGSLIEAQLTNRARRAAAPLTWGDRGVARLELPKMPSPSFE